MDAPTAPAWYLKLPPPVWTLAMLLCAWLLTRSFDGGRIVCFRSLPLAVISALAGITLAVWAARTFAALGTELNPTSPANKQLVTGGPFRLTRNPMYLGLVLVSLGIAFYAGTIPFFVVPLLVFLVCNGAFIPFEEAKMQRQFDGQFTDYTRRTRRWL